MCVCLPQSLARGVPCEPPDHPTRSPRDVRTDGSETAAAQSLARGDVRMLTEHVKRSEKSCSVVELPWPRC